MFGDRNRNGFDVRQHIFISKAEHKPALLLNPLLTQRVASVLHVVIPAVELDHQSALVVGEISEVRTDRMLTPKLQSA